jgi:diguanylate cyclase (GGDEF)-like protein
MVDVGEGPSLVPELRVLVLDLCDALTRFAGHDDAFVERMAPIRALLDGHLTLERLEDARCRLGSLIEQQVAVQRGLQDTRTSLKDMLSTVLERLCAVGDSARNFRQRVDAYREDLAGEPDPETLRRVAGGLLADTGVLAEQIEQSQAHLAQARQRVESFESRVRDLEHELAQTTRLARNDPLTHALNRRGLEEVVRTEAARSARFQVPLTITMVDLDDFKRINDQMGHAGGDRALVHFVTTAQANLRSTDRIARTGGEEFVLIFPATGIEAALDAIRRVQGALARAPIPGEEQRWMLTFSAGAAQWRDGDTLARVLARADGALYQAKQLGKNRVETAL